MDETDKANNLIVMMKLEAAGDVYFELI